MSAHAYTEDQLVEQPAMRLFAELGWSVAQPHPHLGPLPKGEEARAWVDETGLFGRETKGEVVLVGRLRVALVKLNASRMGHDALPREAIAAAIDELTRDRSVLSPYLSGWRMAGVTREFSTNSYLSRKRPA